MAPLTDYRSEPSVSHLTSAEVVVRSIGEDRDAQLVAGVPAAPVEHVALQQGEEALHRGVVRGGGDVAHRTDQSVAGEGLVELSGAKLAGLNWSSQHLEPAEVVDGTASWMDEGVDRTLTDEVTRCSVASSRDRARVLAGDRHRDHD
jgi:hypothetical protein